MWFCWLIYIRDSLLFISKTALAPAESGAVAGDAERRHRPEREIRSEFLLMYFHFCSADQK